MNKTCKLCGESEKTIRANNLCDKCDYKIRIDWFKKRTEKRKIENYYKGKSKIRKSHIKARETYQNTCYDCGFNDFPEILQVHHIDRNTNHNKIENLVLLCPNCHHIRHYKEGTGLYTNHKNKGGNP